MQIFGETWREMTATAYSIGKDFISPEDRAKIDQLRDINSLKGLSQYLKANPLDPDDIPSLSSYLHQVVYSLYVSGS